MTQPEKWPRIAVVGAGAVGGYFGGMLARAGAPVVLIARPAFVEAVKKEGLLLDTLTFKETIRIEASTELQAVSGADIVLFCVKTTDTASTASQLAPLLSSGAIVASLQNGVDNAERIRAASGIDALSAVVYLGSAVPEPGHIKHGGRGDLVIGPKSDRAERVAAVFERAGVPCRVSENIEADLWSKLLGNCGLNAISALARTKYKNIGASPDARRVVEQLVIETLAVARASHVAVPGIDDLPAAVARVLKTVEQMPETYSSTAQDLMRGKRTEIDSLNGYIARRGAELGVPTPVSHTLYTLIKLAENK